MADETNPTPPPVPPFDPEAGHQQRPKLRPVRGFGTQATGPDGQARPVLGLADSKQISDRIVFTQPAMQAVLPLLDGERDLDEVVTQVGRGLTREMLEQLVAQLDHAGLIEGPRFDEMYEKLRSDFDGSDVLPPGQSAAIADTLVLQAAAQSAGEAAMAEGKTREEAQAVAKAAVEAIDEEAKSAQAPEALRNALETWMNKAVESADDPSYDGLPRAVFVPFSAYGQAWMNYGHVYGRLRVVDRPDRVVVLGPNHFGMSTGVCGVDKAFETPLGVSPSDSAMVAAVRSRLETHGSGLGEALFAHQYDHEREHSVELQIPWIQHVFGDGDSHVPVFAALMHDPVVNSGDSYDGQGVSLDAFVEAMLGALDKLGGKTLVIASHELSHVGAAFGDQDPYASQDEAGNAARNKLIQQDQSLVSMLARGQTEELVTSLSWQQNPTRWNSTGVLVAAMRAAAHQGELAEGSFKVHNFAGAVDQQGHALVTTIAAAVV